MANLNENMGYIAQPQTKILTEKVWKQRLDAIETATGTLSAEKKAATAHCLENTRQQIKYMESIAATQSPDIGAYKRFALDMVGAIVPNLIAYDLCSVQAMNNRIGMINFMKYHYGDAKGKVGKGQVFADIRNLNASDKDYTSDHVEGEEFTGTLDWAPVLPGTVKITLADGSVISDDKNKGFVDADGAAVAGASINYDTGAVTGVDVAENVTVSYGYANEHVPAQKIPSITLSIESLPIKAKTRRLAALWGFEASYELQKEYGQSMEDLISTTAAGEINYEIDLEIMGRIHAAAIAATTAEELAQLAWTTIPQTGVYSNLQDHYDSFLITLNRASNLVYQRTRRIRPNYVVCGTDVATVIGANRTFKASGEVTTKGPYFAGTLGQFKVYVSPDMPATSWAMGYKGDTLLDAGFVYAPYMPVMTTSMVQLEDMAGRKGWATMYGTRLVNDKMFIAGEITNA